MPKRILVCGGAGYIGSHMAKWLAQHGYEPVVLDNLSTGHSWAVKWGPLIEADLLDPDALDRAFREHGPFEAVMHFCALSLVGESMRAPYDYYRNNVVGTLNLLQAMQRHDVNRLVFSSTAAVYGLPQTPRIAEDHPKNPINPYGASKLMVERMLADAAHAYGLRSVSLRYFNAAGASPDGDIGEAHEPETHLIANIIRAALGTGPALKIFGTDWPTPDGTCVRDYVHVDDLAQAHGLALKHMERQDGAHAFNLGSGCGHSVLEVTNAVQRISGLPVHYEVNGRRAGDPSQLVASSDRAHDDLDWHAQHSDLNTIVQDAWRWHQSAPGRPLVRGGEGGFVLTH